MQQQKSPSTTVAAGRVTTAGRPEPRPSTKSMAPALRDARGAAALRAVRRRLRGAVPEPAVRSGRRRDRAIARGSGPSARSRARRAGPLQRGSRSLRTTHDYAVPPAPRAIQQDFAITLPWMTAELRAGRTVVLQRLPDDLPPQAQCRARVRRRERHALGDRGAARRRRRPAGRVGRQHLQRRQSLAAAPGGARRAARERSRQRHAPPRQRAQDPRAHRATRGGERLSPAGRSSRRWLRRDRRQQRRDRVACSGRSSRSPSTDAPVLILGETGTGKELVARARPPAAAAARRGRSSRSTARRCRRR